MVSALLGGNETIYRLQCTVWSYDNTGNVNEIEFARESRDSRHHPHVRHEDCNCSTESQWDFLNNISPTNPELLLSYLTNLNVQSNNTQFKSPARL